MSCAQITPCHTFATPEFAGQVTIATVRAGGTYSFGNFEAGTYSVNYLNGANQWVTAWQALSGDAQTMVLHICDGVLTISIPRTAIGTTQVIAEANAAGTKICFNHSGGDISIEFSSPVYGSNQNGSPNATFNLFRQGGTIPPAPPQPTPPTPFSGQTYSLFHCSEKVTCAGDDLPIRNFSSEAVDIPSDPVLTGGSPTLFTQPPVGGSDPAIPPVEPLPISNETGGGTALIPNPNEIPPLPPSPPPPPPPPPPPMTSWNCDGEGNCTDPGDGSGTYGTLEECQNNCLPPPPPPPPLSVTSYSPSPFFAIIGVPFDTSCTDAEGFFGTGFLSTDSVIIAGQPYTPTFVDSTHLILDQATVFLICQTLGVGVWPCLVGTIGPNPRGSAALVGGIEIKECFRCFASDASYTSCPSGDTVSCESIVRQANRLQVGDSMVVTGSQLSNTCFDVNFDEPQPRVICGDKIYSLTVINPPPCPTSTMTRIS